MDDETSGWFTLHDGILKVWEGVCAVVMGDDVLLLKIRDGAILSIHMRIQNLKNVTSDGYWSCAEIIGRLGAEKGFFYYHADNPNNADTMLQVEKLTT
ncbi:unnamed protein product [Strongylus vulgaris]|uniref:Uncharacterized protein n=1 Tax=Strongylus vulgaris TaxID=40348 RepID=A0A3P7LFG6_STRVU|nr:unnamed protein product [Strongylus vulgaris]